MAQHYPPHHTPDGSIQGYGLPAPKRGMSKGTKVAVFGCALPIFVLALIGGCAALAISGDDDMRKEDPPQATQNTGDKGDKDKPADTGNVKPPASEAEQFKGCVNKNGTATEKAAVKHVTKVTGTNSRNNILDAPEVFTDFTGGIMSGDTGSAKLIASAFASCYESDNGLVTVYGADGEILANGNF